MVRGKWVIWYQEDKKTMEEKQSQKFQIKGKTAFLKKFKRNKKKHGIKFYQRTYQHA